MPTDTTGAMNVQAGDSFNVAVMARMRPGLLGKDKVNLPLHQFLKLKEGKPQAKQRGAADGETESSKMAIAKQIQRNSFAFYQTLMRDQFSLLTRIVDRSIIRGSRDPGQSRVITGVD